MFNYNIKDQVLLLNHKTFGLENELKDLEEKIRIGQNRLHGIQRQLRREILQGEEGIPKRISSRASLMRCSRFRFFSKPDFESPSQASIIGMAFVYRADQMDRNLPSGP